LQLKSLEVERRDLSHKASIQLLLEQGLSKLRRYNVY
jgi:hypothetical protein